MVGNSDKPSVVAAAIATNNPDTVLANRQNAVTYFVAALRTGRICSPVEIIVVEVVECEIDRRSVPIVIDFAAVGALHRDGFARGSHSGPF